MNPGTVQHFACAATIVCATAAGCAARTPPPYHAARPITEPTILADTLRTVNGIAFTQNGDTLFTANWQRHDLDANGRPHVRIMEWHHVNGAWTGPFPVPFSTSGTDYQPVFAPDRRTLYFQSMRPLPGAEGETLQNIWFVERRGTGWSEPRSIDELNTPAREGYVSPTADGTLYFNSDRPGGLGLQDIYRVRHAGDRFGTPEPVHDLNTGHSENDLFVDYAGRFVILNRYIEATSGIDLYIAFREGDGWSEPRLLDNANTSEPGPSNWELTPTVTPDGKYLLFTRNGRILQIELAEVIYQDELPGLGRRRRD